MGRMERKAKIGQIGMSCFRVDSRGWVGKGFVLFLNCMGPIAQSVEQRTFNPWVDSSSLSGPTKYLVVLRLFGVQ